jgi:hypothetical protein
MDDEERIARLREIKLGNIRLIGDFYLQNTIPIKIISECIDFLLSKIDDLNIRTLCELIKKICKKLYFEDVNLLDMASTALECLYEDKPLKYNNTPSQSKTVYSVSSKTKFMILDIIEKKRVTWEIKGEDQLKKKDEFVTQIISSRKNSEIPMAGSRKSSINPTNVEYIRRSRFNSRADELKINIEATPNLIDELVTSLGADIEFYQCFRLTEEEFAFIKKANNLFIAEFEQPNLNEEELKSIFNKMMDDIQCEKFIAVGHLLENIFSLNYKQSLLTMSALTYLYDCKMIDQEDIKHGYIIFLF